MNERQEIRQPRMDMFTDPQREGADGVAGAEAQAAAADRDNQDREKQIRAVADYLPGENMLNALRQGSLGLARSALVNELEDNRLDDYAVYGAAAWVESRVPGLFDDYGEHSLAGKIINDPGRWDADYYHLQTVYLNTNFARDRFEHLMVLRNVLRGRGIAGFTRIVPGRAPISPDPQEDGFLAYPDGGTDAAPPLPVWRIALLTGGTLALLAVLIAAWL